MELIPIYDATAPVACTATGNEIQGRIQQIERMRSDLTRLERTEHGLLLHFPNRPDIDAHLRTFTIDEKGCCAFWGFDDHHQRRRAHPPLGRSARRRRLLPTAGGVVRGRRTADRRHRAPLTGPTAARRQPQVPTTRRMVTSSPSSSPSAFRTEVFSGTMYLPSFGHSEVDHFVSPMCAVTGIIPQP